MNLNDIFIAKRSSKIGSEHELVFETSGIRSQIDGVAWDFCKNFGANLTISIAPNGAVITIAKTAIIKIIFAK